jgi:hypothetical protein
LAEWRTTTYLNKLHYERELRQWLLKEIAAEQDETPFNAADREIEEQVLRATGNHSTFQGASTHPPLEDDCSGSGYGEQPYVDESSLFAPIEGVSE